MLGKTRQSFNQYVRTDVAKLFRLHLVQPPVINAAVSKKLFAGNAVKETPDHALQGWIAIESTRQRRLEVEKQVVKPKARSS